MTRLVTFGEASIRLTPPGTERLERADRLRVGTTGPECNAGVAARRLGADVTWVSRLPDTPLGRRVAAELRSHDLDLAVDWAVETERQGLTFFERGGAPRGDAAVEDRADAPVARMGMDDLPLEVVEAADGGYVTGATAGLSTPLAGATARFLKTASDAGGLAAFGLDYRPGRWETPDDARETLTEFFPAVDVFVGHEGDVATVFDREGQPAEVVHGLASEWGFETVALVRERTCVAWHDATIHEYPVPEVETTDVSGSDDAFAGAFLASLLADADVPTALRVATATRALARTVPGAAPTVTRAEVERVTEGIGTSRE